MPSMRIRGNQINWNQLYYFSEIAAAGSIKEAGERLGLSPSTLSEHLSQLETDLSLKLFHRQHRKLALTEDGARLYQHARQMFDTGKRLVDVVSPIPLGSYPMSVGIVPGASYASAYRVMSEFALRHPNVSMRFFHYQHEELEQALLDAKLDFGFTDRKSERRNLVQTTIEASDLRFFVSTQLAGQSLGALLQKLPLLICKADPSSPSSVETILETLDLVPRSVIASEFPSLIEDLCRRGAGVAVLGGLHFQDEANIKALRLPKDFPAFTEKLHVTWSSHSTSTAAVANLCCLLEELR